jgi:acetyl-CoA synthetase
VQVAADWTRGSGAELEGALKEEVRRTIGGFAVPDVVHVAAGLPKTRSGKIMRRILRKIAAGEYDGLGDVTTLAEPEVVEKLIAQHRDRVASMR